MLELGLIPISPYRLNAISISLSGHLYIDWIYKCPESDMEMAVKWYGSTNTRHRSSTSISTKKGAPDHYDQELLL